MARTPREDLELDNGLDRAGRFPADPDDYADAGEGSGAERAEADLEAPEADAAEQHLSLLESRDVPAEARGLDEADPADAAEQRRVVELDEDDYR